MATNNKPDKGKKQKLVSECGFALHGPGVVRTTRFGDRDVANVLILIEVLNFDADNFPDQKKLQKKLSGKLGKVINVKQ